MDQFSQQTIEHFTRRIDALGPDTPGKWGSM